MTVSSPGTARRSHVHRDRLIRRLALRGILLLEIAELLALALRGTELVVTGWPAG